MRRHHGMHGAAQVTQDGREIVGDPRQSGVDHHRTVIAVQDVTIENPA
jgi:hypothetical protein